MYFQVIDILVFLNSGGILELFGEFKKNISTIKNSDLIVLGWNPSLNIPQGIQV